MVGEYPRTFISDQCPCLMPTLDGRISPGYMYRRDTQDRHAPISLSTAQSACLFSLTLGDRIRLYRDGTLDSVSLSSPDAHRDSARSAWSLTVADIAGIFCYKYALGQCLPNDPTSYQSEDTLLMST